MMMFMPEIVIGIVIERRSIMTTGMIVRKGMMHDITTRIQIIGAMRSMLELVLGRLQGRLVPGIIRILLPRSRNRIDEIVMMRIPCSMRRRTRLSIIQTPI